MTENPLRKEYWFGTADPRPLALFRLLFGSVVLADLLYRISDVPVFLSDQGLVPRDSISWHATDWSVFRFAGSPTAVMSLYLAGCAAVAAVVIGYRTRIAQVAMFVFLASIYQRQTAFAGLGQDRVMGTVSFWLLFADSGAVWSLDWILKRRTEGQVSAIGLRLLQWQFCLVLLFAGLHKLGTWRDGLAIYRFLQIRGFATPFGAAFLAWPVLCSAMTWSTLLIELTAPLLLIPLAPLAPRWMRAAGILAVASLFLGILACLEVGSFAWAMLSGLLLFVLPEWLDRLGLVVPAARAATATATAPQPHRAILPVVGMVQLGLVIWSLFAIWMPMNVGRPLPLELQATNLRQDWILFVDVKLSSVWWSDLGTLSDGSQQEVLERTVPAIVVGASPERHWEWLRFLMSGFEKPRRRIVDYACREFDRASPTRLSTLQLDLHEQPAVDPGEPPAVETVRTFNEKCP